MRSHRHSSTQKRIDTLFTSGLSASKRAQLYNEVENCQVCAEYFRRYQALESALTGSRDGISPLSKERILDGVLQNVLTSDAPDPPKRTSLIWGRAVVAVGVSALASAAVIALLLVPSAPPSPHRTSVLTNAQLAPIEVIAAKGHPVRETADIGFRLFQVAEQELKVTEKSDLSLDDIVTFTYTYAKPNDGYLTLFGIQESGEVRWYYPNYGEMRSIPIKGNTIDEPLKDGIDLSVNHLPGWLRIVAIFSDRPIDSGAVEEGVDTLRQSGGDIESLSSLPDKDYGTPCIQYSIMVNIGGNS